MGHMTGMAGSRAVAGGGGGITPPVTSGLGIYYHGDTGLFSDAGITPSTDGGVVGQWNDQSGNARHATQTGGGNKPTWDADIFGAGKGGVQFNSGLWLNLPTGYLTGLTAAEVFLVSKVLVDPPTNGNLAGIWTLGTDGSDQNDVYPWTDSKVYLNFGSTARKSTNKNPDTALTTAHVLNVLTKSGEWTMRINNASSGNDFFTTATNTVGWHAAPHIGRSKQNGGSTAFNGYYRAFLLYDRELDSTERTDTYDFCAGLI